jgi:hypothetical protein
MPIFRKDKDVEKEKSPEDVLGTSFLIGTLMYSTIAPFLRDLSDEEVKEKIFQWEQQCTQNTIKSLSDAGYTIVKKEPAIEKLLM